MILWPRFIHGVFFTAILPLPFLATDPYPPQRYIEFHICTSSFGAPYTATTDLGRDPQHCPAFSLELQDSSSGAAVPCPQPGGLSCLVDPVCLLFCPQKRGVGTRQPVPSGRLPRHIPPIYLAGQLHTWDHDDIGRHPSPGSHLPRTLRGGPGCSYPLVPTLTSRPQCLQGYTCHPPNIFLDGETGLAATCIPIKHFASQNFGGIPNSVHSLPPPSLLGHVGLLCPAAPKTCLTGLVLLAAHYASGNWHGWWRWGVGAEGVCPVDSYTKYASLTSQATLNFPNRLPTVALTAPGILQA